MPGTLHGWAGPPPGLGLRTGAAGWAATGTGRPAAAGFQAART
ncbi:hypothetical protein [Kitasatospora sp. MMS16-BH015]|nr:hypothetical protein [Kitasatospora sp. MMS16-BH015]